MMVHSLHYYMFGIKSATSLHGHLMKTSDTQLCRHNIVLMMVHSLHYYMFGIKSEHTTVCITLLGRSTLLHYLSNIIVSGRKCITLPVDLLHYRALIILLSGILYNINRPVLHYQSIIGCKVRLLFCRAGCLAYYSTFTAFFTYLIYNYLLIYIYYLMI